MCRHPLPNAPAMKSKVLCLILPSFCFFLSLFLCRQKQKIVNMDFTDIQQVYPLLSAGLLVISELLPFIGKTEHNGILHGVIRSMRQALNSTSTNHNSKIKDF